MFIWMSSRHDKFGGTMHIAEKKEYFDAHGYSDAKAMPGVFPVAEITPFDASSFDVIEFVESARQVGFHICFCDEA